ncbi:MAG TPA: class I SAM-dependent methyltransferase [Pseudonocardiaceae bacterium]|jgi:SAM-dependent methyltransferase
MDQDEHARRASSFGSQAAAYAEYRPDYPAELLAWALAPLRGCRTKLRVLDIGAGTGKLSAGLLAQDVDVVAVEPDPAMRAELTSRFPEVDAMPGSAEELPLPDSSVHAAFAGQALHWFDLDRALPEIRRVLRPGGFLVAMWNAYDDKVPWVAEFCAASGSVARSDQDIESDILDPLGRTEVIEFPNRIRRTVDSLVATVATQSDMLISTPEERDRTLAAVREYLLANPMTARGEFDVPIQTFAIRATPS